VQFQCGIHTLWVEAQMQLIITVAIGAPRAGFDEHVAHGTQMNAAVGHQRRRRARQFGPELQHVDRRVRDVDARY
jgi:hypothetical protein